LGGRQELVAKLGKTAGEEAADKLEASSYNAILQTIFALQHKLAAAAARHKRPRDRTGAQQRRGGASSPPAELNRQRLAGEAARDAAVAAAHYGLSASWPWGLLALDVAYDSSMNAYVLDVNSGPAPTGMNHEPWYLDERSATIRGAVCRLAPSPYSLHPAPYSLLPAPYSLLPRGVQQYVERYVCK